MTLSAIVNSATKEVQVLNARGQVMRTLALAACPDFAFAETVRAYLHAFGITELLEHRSTDTIHVYAELV